MAINLEIHTRHRAFGTVENSTAAGTVQLPVDEDFSALFATGHATNHADVHHKIVAADAFPSISFNLEDGSITDFRGQPIRLAKIKRLAVYNRGTTITGTIVVSGNLTSDMGAGAAFGPDGRFIWENPVDGALVTADTKDTLTLTASVSGLAYVVGIIGVGQ